VLSERDDAMTPYGFTTEEKGGKREKKRKKRKKRGKRASDREKYTLTLQYLTTVRISA